MAVSGVWAWATGPRRWECGLSRAEGFAKYGPGCARCTVAAHPYELIDVFTDQPLAGNQLAVFQHGEAIDESLLRPLARELNLSETVFLFPPETNGHNRMRIFTT